MAETNYWEHAQFILILSKEYVRRNTSRRYYQVLSALYPVILFF